MRHEPPIMEVVPLAPPVSPWFPVGVRKLAVMCVGTLGLYQVYWFYEQWRHAAAQEDEDIWPWARAVFGVLFCYPLFERMTEWARERGVEIKDSALLLSAAFVVFTFAQRLPGAWALVTLLTALPLLAAQARINAVPAMRDLPPDLRNDRLSPINVFGVLVGIFAIWMFVTGVREAAREHPTKAPARPAPTRSVAG